MEAVNVSKFETCGLRTCEDNREFNILKGRTINLKQFVKEHQSNELIKCLKEINYLLIDAVSNNTIESLVEFENLRLLEISNIVSDNVEFLKSLKNLQGLIIYNNRSEALTSFLIKQRSSRMKFIIYGFKTNAIYNMRSIILFDQTTNFILDVNDSNFLHLNYNEKTDSNENVHVLIIDFANTLTSTEQFTCNHDNVYWGLYPNLKIIHFIECSYSKIVIDSQALRNYKNLRIIIKSGIYNDNWIDIIKHNRQLKLILFYNKHFKDFEYLVMDCGSFVEEFYSCGYGLINHTYHFDDEFNEQTLTELEIQQGFRKIYPNDNNNNNSLETALQSDLNVKRNLNQAILHEKIAALIKRRSSRRKIS